MGGVGGVVVRVVDVARVLCVLWCDVCMGLYVRMRMWVCVCVCGCVYGRVRGCFAVAGVGLSMGVCV